MTLSVRAALFVAFAATGGCLAVVATAAPPTSTEIEEMKVALGLDEVASLRKQRAYEEAEGRAREILERAERDDGERSLAAALAMGEIAAAMASGDKAHEEDCLRFARGSLEIRESLYGTDHVVVARALGLLGRIQAARGRQSEARKSLERSLRIQERDLGPADASTMWTRSRLVSLYKSMELFDDAIRLAEEDIAIREEQLGPDHPDLAGALYNLGGLLRRLRRLDESERAFLRARSIVEESKGPEDRLVAYIENGLGNLYDDLGDFQRARASYERALTIARSAFGEEHSFTVACLSNLGYLQRELGDYEVAIPLFEQVLRAQESTLGPDHERTAATLANLAEAQLLAGDLDTAERFAERALGICERTMEAESYEWALCMGLLAQIDLDRGLVGEATVRLERAASSYRRTLGPEHFETAEVEVLLARAYLAGDDPEAAQGLLEHASASLEKSVGPGHPLNAELSADLAVALSALGQSELSLRTALQAEEQAREHARLTIAYLPERQALRFVSVRAGGLSLAIAVAAQEQAHEAEVWDSLIRSRALVKDEMALRRRHAAPPDSDLAPELADYQKESRDLANLLVRAPGGDADYRERIRAARERRETAERRLAATSAEFRAREKRASTGLQQVEEALPARSALVAFTRYGQREADTNYAAFVVRSDGSGPRLIPLGPNGEIDAAVAAWGRETIAASDTYRSVGSTLRRAIWDPVAAHLGDVDLVFIVPDGMLHHVSFVALPEEDTRYLIESGPRVHYLSAERDLVGHRAGTPGVGLLAVGNPAFGGADEDEASAQGFRFAPLPASEREARQIASLWGDTGGADAIVLTGAAATEDDVKRLAPGRRVVHLATHGFFLGPDARSATADTRGIGGLAQARPHAAGSSDLRLSGLALAGANVREHEVNDGVLTAEEIAALDLSAVEWAVLSACDTGVGEIQSGEGVLGLRRAFEVAGAGTLLMTLWSIEDDAARQWMAALYGARWENGLTTIDAVHRATLSVLQERRNRGASDHPFYWGAFVAAGRWE